MDVLIWTIGTVVCSRIERVKQFRSPIVPKWDSPPLTPAGVMAVLLDGDSGPILTEHGLKLVHETWQTRHAALWLRQRALRDARSKGLIGCWAGMCTPATLQATKEAVEEAQWVEQHLSDAIEWCQGRKVAKMPFGKFVKARGGASECVLQFFPAPVALPEVDAAHPIGAPDPISARPTSKRLPRSSTSPSRLSLRNRAASHPSYLVLPRFIKTSPRPKRKSDSARLCTPKRPTSTSASRPSKAACGTTRTSRARTRRP
jgi:hypothetical protein